MSVVFLGMLAYLAYWCYRKGKHIGSVKGYHAGRYRRHRKKR